MIAWQRIRALLNMRNKLNRAFGLLALLTLCARMADMPRDDAAARLAPAMDTSTSDLPSFGAPNPIRFSRSNQSLAEDFMALSFVLESGRQIPRISRFEGPITVALAPSAPPALEGELSRLLTRLRTEAGIAISATAYRTNSPAKITIEALPAERIAAAVPQAACFVVPNASTWQEFIRQRGRVTSDWASLTTRSRAAIFLPADSSLQEMRDCLHEELGQALGPLNDLYDLTDSVFNDDNFHAVLTTTDMMFLRIFNDPSLQSGMGQADVAARLPAILGRINPTGGVVSSINLANRDNRAWSNAIGRALGPNMPEGQRLEHAQAALNIAQRSNMRDARLGFSYYALGRIALARDPDRAAAAFASAQDIYQRLPNTDVQRAHIAMQIGALALARGDMTAALLQSTTALPIARRSENAHLLASLSMLRATALEGLGRGSEAQRSRLEAYAWGRYGFADRSLMQIRLGEIANLAPNATQAARN